MLENLLGSRSFSTIICLLVVMSFFLLFQGVGPSLNGLTCWPRLLKMLGFDCFHISFFVSILVYIYTRSPLWEQHMGLKLGAIGNTLGKHIENLRNMLGTHWEHRRNVVGTKEKLPIGCMYFWFPKLVVTIFGLG